MALWAVGCFGFFQYCYPYRFFYQEQNQLFLWSRDYLVTYLERPGGAALLVGDFLTQFYYYLYAGASILTACLLLTGILLFRALVRFGTGRPVALAVSLGVMTLGAVCHFSHAYRLSSTIAMMGWAAVLWAVSLVGSWRRRLPALVLALLPAYLLLGLPRIRQLAAPDFLLERILATDCEYYFGNYDRVITLVENTPQPTREMLFFYNLVQARRGQLPDRLLRFQPTELGTFQRIGPQTPLLTIRNMNELYWALGDMTFTERAAMMAMVFSPDNRNVRMIRRLAECNYVSGDTLAAGKYLRILDKTLVYRRWAARVRESGSALYREKRLTVNRRDTVTVTDNAHFLLTQLLDTNPANTVALDYLLCGDLLLKDIAGFKRDYDRYCTATGHPRPKTLYQEALCIWLAGTSAPQEEWERYVGRPDVMQRFAAYNERRGAPQFKGTYWYYFDKIKPPKP